MDERIEGWAAGLQIASLTLQGRADKSSYLRTITGSNRYILDYLMDEVYLHQDPDIQDFLIKTSILDHLTGPLCDAVTGNGNVRGQAALTKLEKANLFFNSPG